MSKIWTDDDIAKVKYLWNQGMKLADIALEIGRSRDSVVGKTRGLKLKRNYTRLWTSKDLQRLQILWKDGQKLQDIALDLGRTRGAIIKKAIDIGLQRRRKNAWTEQEKDTLIKLVGQGLLTKDIANRMGKNYNGTKNQIASCGLKANKPKPKETKRKKYKPVEMAKVNRGFYPDWSVARCVWPIGHPNDKDFLFCQGKKHLDYPYCLDHCHEAYINFATVERI